jgi:hypothetical protein
MPGLLFERGCRFMNRRMSGIFRTLNLEWDKELEEAIEFTKLDVNPQEVVVSAWATSMLVIISFSILSLTIFFLGYDPLPWILFGFILAALLAYYISVYPKRLARLKKIKALGHAPEIVAYLIIPLKQNPNLESAVRFAAEHGEGQMAEDLRGLMWDVWAGKYRSVGEALPILGHKWGKDIKGFEDAMYAIRTSQIERSESRRLDTLDRALDAILKSIQRKFDEFINYLRLPTMVLFAGGAVFPLVIIILLPIVSFMGIDIGTPENLFIGLMALVLGIFLFSDHILSKRPAAFKPINIPDGYPGLPAPGKMVLFGREGSAWKISLGVAVTISLLSLPYFLGISNSITDGLNTMPVIVGICAGLWLYIRGTSLPKKGIRDSLKRTEEDTIEASFQLGNRLITGMSAEEALVRVAAMMSSPGNVSEKSGISGIFERAIRNIRYLNMGLEDSLFDKQRGALKDVFSGVVNSIMRIFTITMRKSVRAASEALIVAANHIREIKRVENALRDRISYTTSMIRITAVMINPIICALAVYIAEVFRNTIVNTKTSMIHYGEEFGTGIMLKEPATKPEMLQLITGVYMIALLLVLIRYVSVLESGDDPVLYRLEIARGIPIALSMFIAILLLTNFM